MKHHVFQGKGGAAMDTDAEKSIVEQPAAKKPEALHSGHRKRMFDRVLKNSRHSFDTLEDHEVLEMLLYFVYTRKNTNPIAHRLIDTFGSLGKVLNAPLDALREVEECGPQTALLIKLCRELFTRWQREENTRRAAARITSSEKAAEYLLGYFTDLQHERVIAIFLDNKCAVMDTVVFPPGQVNYSKLDFRAIIQRAINLNAAMLVLAHNHPDGLAVPSKADRSATNMLNTVLYSMQITFFDHLIFGDGNTYYSMHDHGELTPFR